nr:uncharacterized protein CI109_002072 [Kwoniella shandongensis]KAA5529646.1 hypothetical protein CI109_002072 [Kwoniella shandongensis]
MQTSETAAHDEDGDRSLPSSFASEERVIVVAETTAPPQSTSPNDSQTFGPKAHGIGGHLTMSHNLAESTGSAANITAPSQSAPPVDLRTSEVAACGAEPLVPAKESQMSSWPQKFSYDPMISGWPDEGELSL